MILQRTDYRPDGIFSELIDGEIVYKTLEHSYDNAPKVPPGTYRCVRGSHQLHNGPPFQTFEITGVAGHKGILFHVGNFNRDSEGCVLVGSALVKGDPWMVSGSKAAFARFMESQDGVDKLRTDAEQRLKDARTAIAAAQSKARAATSKAQGTLATAPSNPADLCQSLDALNRAKISERSGIPKPDTIPR